MKCPYCKESIKKDSLKCKHCHADLTTEEAKKLLKEVNKTSGIVKFGGLIILFAIIASAVGRGNTPSSQNSSPTTPVVQKTTFETNCLSSWDGSFRSIISGFKANLKDPSSFEHVETTYSNENDGNHMVLMKYRAKNGFGALDIGAVKFKSDDSCNIIGKIEQL